MKMEEATNILNKKYYHKYTGKTLNLYEWTILKCLIQKEVTYLDKKFKNAIRRNLKKRRKQTTNNG